MNRIGGRSNTGEGGEDPARFIPDANGDSRSSAIKQVRVGRFGSPASTWSAPGTADQMAQGAKPGEGGQLPGHKVDATIARVRHSTPGVGLISAAAASRHYSIEDLAQLIYDLRTLIPRAPHQREAGFRGWCRNRRCRRGESACRCCSESRETAEATGASPLTSLKHAGIPWELGLAETHQVLVLNNLRSRIIVQTTVTENRP
jgi:glutamate synthase domain-containing protein 2